MDGDPACTPESDGDEDCYSVLTRMLTAVSQDHSQLRALVYEFARRKLRKSLAAQFEDGDWAGMQEQMQALETAISQIESDYADKTLTVEPAPPLTNSAYMDELTSSQSAQRPASSRSASTTALTTSSRATELSSPVRPLSDGDVFFAVRFGRESGSALLWKFQLIIAAVLGLLIYAVIVSPSMKDFWGSHSAAAPAKTATSSSPVSEVRAPSYASSRAGIVRGPKTPNFPVPDGYGAFALTNGQLTELESLQMRVPDPRVAISPTISTPSRAHLPAGKLEFIFFRRDLANTAPDRVTLRVIARVVRALKFDSGGKPTLTTIDDAWVVRSNSYQMRVAPIADNPEMILVRPDPPDLVLPAGRYALVLKGTAYDFTLDGQNGDAAHCLERTDAQSSPVYTECRTP
jgi:hypothetical protein